MVLTTARTAAGTVRPSWAYPLALLAFVQFVVVLNTSIVNVALGPIGAQWGMSAAALSWVVNAYLLPFGGLLLLGGRLGDLLGRRRMLLSGAVTLTGASAFAAFAWNGWVLLAARAGQGIGAALLAPAALALTVVLFPAAAQRQRALGVVGAVSGLGGAAGVLFSGVLIQSFGWRSIFVVTAVMGVAVIAATPLLVPADATGDLPRRTLDLPGALLVTLGLTVVVFALSAARGSRGDLLVAVIGLVAGSALLVAFVARQRRAADPLVRLGILRTGTVGRANLLMLLLGAVWIGFFFYLPLLQQQVLGYSPLVTGLSQLPLAATTIAGSWLAPKAAGRLGRRTALVAGLGLLAAGLAWISVVPEGTSFVADLLGPTLLIGTGLGVAFVLLTGLGLHGVAPAESGLASGLINTTRQVGGGLGLAVLTAAAALATSRDGGDVAATAESFRWAFRTGFVIAAGAAITALIVIPAGRDRH